MITTQTFARTLSLTILCVLSASLLYASTPVATLTCQSALGSRMTTPVFQFSLGTQSASLSLNVAALGPLLAAQAASTSYTTCTLDNNAASASMSNVTVGGVYATGIGQGFASTELPAILPALTAPQLYATANLSFGALTVGDVTMHPSKASATTSPATSTAPITESVLAKLRLAISKAIQAHSLGSQ